MGAYIDNIPLLARNHMLGNFLAQPEHALEVDPHQAVVRFFLDIKKTFSLIDACTVDKDIDLPKIIKHISHAFINRNDIHDIQPERFCRFILFYKFRSDFLTAQSINITQHNRASRSGKPTRKSLADPAGSPGQKYDLSIQRKNRLKIIPNFRHMHPPDKLYFAS
jgi:hypothetical protein